MKLKQIWVSMLVVCLLASVAAGCSSGNSASGNQTNTGKTKKGTDQSNSNSNAGTDAKSKKFTIHILSSGQAPKNGVGKKMINQKYNVVWDDEQVPGSAFGQKKDAMIASGNMPEVLFTNRWSDSIVKLAKEGAILPLDQYISQFDTFKNIPQYVWDGMKGEDGKIYGIPNFFSAKFGQHLVIRKDWLDNLGLQMPTNLEQLKKVAIAFTKDDPNQDGKNDTYGIEIGTGISPPIDTGAYWNEMDWYHKNAQGQYIPGIISQGSKQRIQFLHDLYQAGAIPQDWATTKRSDIEKNFWAGKFGIYRVQSYDKGQSSFQTLGKINPNAKVVMVPPFKAPDGSQGYLALNGYYQFFLLSAKLKNQPDKVKRILQILNDAMKWIPPDQRNPNNPHYDWLAGHVRKGYTMVNGKPQPKDGNLGLSPGDYLGTRMWPPSESALNLPSTATDPIQKALFQSAQDIVSKYKFYIDPSNRINSPIYNKKFWDIYSVASDAQTKMIVGQLPISQWDQAVVKAWMDKGGKQIVDDVNQRIKAKGLKGEWK